MEITQSPPAAATKVESPRLLKIGTFHLGSALSDILISGIWNRILIADMGLSAALVALLSALRYLIAPLTVWSGHRSDTKTFLGKRRLPYIYLGRLLTWLSLPLLPLSIMQFAKPDGAAIGWALSPFIFLLYGIGTLISGSPFLALVRESVPETRQSLAVIVVQTFLLAGFALAPILYSLLMPDYTLEAFWRVVWVGMGGAGFLWFVSVWGEERTRRASASPATDERPFPLGALMRQAWGQQNTRLFFGVLALGSIALFAQDAVLEPFGAELFGLSIGETTRFNSYYGTGLLLAMVVGGLTTRRWLPQQYTRITLIGLVAVAASLLALIGTAMVGEARWLIPVLFLFGVASGIYTFGGISLMMAMTDEHYAGAYLGIWSMAQFVFRGVGIALGGFLLTVGKSWWAMPRLGYTMVFALEAGAALAAALLLWRVSRIGYLFTPSERPSRGTMMVE
ncbi:MAG: BCD family MFS transporter [Anaerolineales bacterium]|nr:BCD family MFS transporter [Anaerolineales bacterium]MCB9127166.1 BCD family MFS transporter [Ardenticatenales bacterium]MCB9171926.1 BCD family MFS transporter [Ardenticatenales bacterium]